jgi:uracil-DNA glycosylase family 4
MKFGYKSKKPKYNARLKSSYINTIVCKDERCPLFKQCPQIPSQGVKTATRSPKVFFVFSSPHEDDASEGLPAVSQSGIYFRDKWLTPFSAETGGMSYLITNLVRCPISDKGKTRWPTQLEFQSCWGHFMAEFQQFQPPVLVVFGIIAYGLLYRQAKNKSEIPSPDEYNLKQLRKMDIEIELIEGQKTRLFVNYTPAFFLSSPAAADYLTEDMHRVLYHFKPHRQQDQFQTNIKIDKIDLLKTPQEVLGFMDYLYRGLPRDEMFDLAFDTETCNLNRVYNNKFLSWQFSWKPDHAVVIPIEHPEMPLFADIQEKLKLIEAFQKVLSSTPEQTRIKWIIAHKATFDFGVLYGLYRILPRGSIPIWDTLLGMHWVNENRKHMKAVLDGNPYALETLGKELLQFKYKEGHKEARADLVSSLDFNDFVEYGGTDTIVTWHIKQEQQKLASQQKKEGLAKLNRFMKRYYSPAVVTLSVMECNGLYVAQDQLDYLMGEDSPIWNRIESIETKELQESPEVRAFREQYKKQIQGESECLEEDLWGDSDSLDFSEMPSFDPNKKDQENLFYLDFLKLQPLKFSKKTQQATLDKNFLLHYADQYLTLPEIQPYLSYYRTEIGRDENDEPIYPKNPLQLILEYREVKKLGTTYLASIDKKVNDRNGDCLDRRIRANFHLSGTDTGRLSSSNPNFQNLPSGRSKMAKEIKNLFQAQAPSKLYPNGTALIQLDYKTAEVRWAAIYANDKNLIRLFNEARASLEEACSPTSTMSDEEFAATQLASDIHRRTASLMFDVPPLDVTKMMRQASKSITFGLLFGMSEKTLASNNGWSESEADDKMKKFFAAFPDLERWLVQIPRRAEELGFVETLMGRRRRLNFLFDTGLFHDKEKASRLAKNAPIQGQSSDGGILGVYDFLNYLLVNKLERRWLIQNVVHDSCLVQVPMEDVEKAIRVMQHCFVQGMADYIEKHFNFKLPLPIECDIEVGLRYGDLMGWDGRPSTIPKILEYLDNSAKKLWAPKKQNQGKPASSLDLVTWQGNG